MPNNTSGDELLPLHRAYDDPWSCVDRARHAYRAAKEAKSDGQ